MDIDATVEKNRSVIQHAFSRCDTVASYYGIGKGKILTTHLAVHFILYTPRKFNVSMESFHLLPGTISLRFLGDSNLRGVSNCIPKYDRLGHCSHPGMLPPIG